MTPQCQEWIAHCVKKFPCKGAVLEVGSFDVNGNPRHHFKDESRFESYIGVDMREGPCVDKVMNTQALEFGDDTFGTIVDAERIEHDNRFWVTIKELFRVCRPGGHIIITTRSWGGFPPHDYPSDYWRFMDNGLRDLLEYAGFTCLATAYGERWQGGDRAVFAIGRKPVSADKVMAPFSVVIPSKNIANLVSCVNAIINNEPNLDTGRIIVVDDGLGRNLTYVTTIKGKKPFVFARNVNIGIAHAKSDVIVMNDDAILQTPNGLSEMVKFKGICAASIIESDTLRCNPRQSNQGFTKRFRPEHDMVAFICVSIPKQVQEKVGPLDERFVGYGFDDNDYCRRAREKGIPLSIYDGCIVNHRVLTPTFRSDENWEASMAQNRKLYKEKYQSPEQR